MRNVSYTDKENPKDKPDKMDTWIRLMELGGRTGCHQMPERSFFIKGYQFPVCARCCGVFLGYLLAPIIYVKMGFYKLRYCAVAGLFLMFLDWLLQAVHIKESTNIRRFLTGIAGGFGSMVVFIKLLMVMIIGLKKRLS